jgi:uncharacterized protein (TIGR03000 family)
LLFLEKIRGSSMYVANFALPGFVLMALAAPVLGQTPPYLEPGTYNAPAGAGATAPAYPIAPLARPALPPGPSSIYSQNPLNRDILNPNQGILFQEFENSVRRTSRPDLEAKAIFAVKLPAADAQLWVNGQLTSQKGLERKFVTPPLAPGHYRYQFRVSWTANKASERSMQTVTFQPGEDLVIDLSKKR